MLNIRIPQLIIHISILISLLNWFHQKCHHLPIIFPLLISIIIIHLVSLLSKEKYFLDRLLWRTWSINTSIICPTWSVYSICNPFMASSIYKFRFCLQIGPIIQILLMNLILVIRNLLIWILTWKQSVMSQFRSECIRENNWVVLLSMISRQYSQKNNLFLTS